MEYRVITALRPHPLNATIYGAETMAGISDLAASVRANGIYEPILIAQDGTIISGHRRHAAAQEAGMVEVPVAIFGSDDPLDIETALIETNRQRQKTNEQLGREATRLLEIERERAKRRHDEQAARNLAPQPLLPTVATLPPSAPTIPVVQGKARDVVAQQLGVSGHKVERAAAVVQTIDTLKREGRQREAEQLRTTLNTKSVQRAYDEAKEAGHIVVPPPKPAVTPKATEVITLEQWPSLSEKEQAAALGSREGKTGFNKQDTDHIEWAMHSWNPVTGCKHDCSYCYARDIAARYYPHGFVPALLPYRLAAPYNATVPAEASQNIAYKNVFTCSMADLFGKWVPRQWIEAVLEVVRDAPQWNFLFLTKFPTRLAEFEFPDNAWLGTSVDAQARIPNAEKAFARVQGGVKWLSCEPMLERLTFSRLDLFDWVVIGGASRSTQTPEFRPPREWITHLERQAEAAGCKVYEKTNLLERRREYPGAPEPAQVVVPDAFKMGYLQRDVAPAAASGGGT